MCDILKSNFDKKLPLIIDHLKRCSFLSIDSEFTGLLSSEEHRSSLFDDGLQRYKKLRQSIEPFMIIQLGISIFHFDRDQNKYVATPYNFYLFPQSFSFIDKKFLCQSQSFQYLCNSKFDFNKLFYDGISFLNQEEELQVKQDLHSGQLFKLLQRSLFQDEEDIIQEYCSLVAVWAATASTNDEYYLDVNHNNTVITYLIHKEVRCRYQVLWTFPTDDYKIKVIKIGETDRKKYELNSVNDRTLENEVFHSILGFTKVFKEIVKLKKPVVGHNFLLDLMLIYKQFVKPLPTKYSVFKKEIMNIFPEIYDTKHISFELRQMFRSKDVWKSNTLKNLFRYFVGKGTKLVIYAPFIECEGEYKPQNEMFHEAGYDAYCTGYCFIRMAHLFLLWDPVNNMFLIRSLNLSSTELLASVSPMKNCVNIIRGQVDYIKLDGQDQSIHKPPWIHVECRGFNTIDTYQVAELFAKFGSVDVMAYTRYSALVAAGNYSCAKEILKQFEKHKDFKVRQYNRFFHSVAARTIFWSSVVISSTAVILFCFTHFKKVLN